jgi:hypothetical protein
MPRVGVVVGDFNTSGYNITEELGRVLIYSAGFCNKMNKLLRDKRKRRWGIYIVDQRTHKSFYNQSNV